MCLSIEYLHRTSGWELQRRNEETHLGNMFAGPVVCGRPIVPAFWSTPPPTFPEFTPFWSTTALGLAVGVPVLVSVPALGPVAFGSWALESVGFVEEPGSKGGTMVVSDIEVGSRKKESK